MEKEVDEAEDAIV